MCVCVFDFTFNIVVHLYQISGRLVASLPSWWRQSRSFTVVRRTSRPVTLTTMTSLIESSTSWAFHKVDSHCALLLLVLYFLSIQASILATRFTMICLYWANGYTLCGG